MIKLVVKTLKLGDVEDPEVYLGAVAYDWFKTEHGAWVKEHGRDLTYHGHVDRDTMGHAYRITASFEDELALIYKLKWGDVSR
jgi:hypothetical protein